MRNRRIFLVLLIALATAFAACSDDGTGNNPDAESDTGNGDSSLDVSPDSDSSLDGDADGDDDSEDSTQPEVVDPDSRPLGASCIDGIQCASNLCVLFDAGLQGFCSQICNQPTDCASQDPDAEFQCLNLPQASGDVIRGCIDTTVCFDPDNDDYGVGPGCANVGFDCDQTNAEINPGAAERCDDIDHNCNGLILDAVTFEEPSCDIASEIGACAVGSKQCEEVLASDGESVVDGTEVCEQVIFPGDLDEICNGVDDDCDGVRDDFVDDDGNYEVPGLGISCATGVSTCPNGKNACDASSGNVICLATGENPNNGDESLVCDGLDNNCNGEIDEPFKDDNGIYFMADNCGSCDVNCDNFWDGRPNDFNVVPFCDANENFALCDFDCAAGFVDADGLDDNGCELNPDEQAVYVTRGARGGIDNGECGSYQSPCATIAFAINKVSNDSTKLRVRVAEGSYGESVSLVDGISVLGGHNAVNWTRDVDANVTTLTGTITDSGQSVTVLADGITTATEFSGFRVQPATATAGRNSVGMYIINSSSALSIIDNDIQASAGGRGVEGSRGSNGQGGSDGSDGRDTRNDLDECAGNRGGGDGAVKECSNLRGGGSFVVNGGDGADADGCPEFAQRQGPGMAGQGPDASGGAGGVSADSRRGIERSGGGRTCSSPKDDDFSDGNPAIFFPELGARGAAGNDGAAGQGADNDQGSVAANVWRGDDGSAGISGVPGGGGGGGGSSHGIREDSSERYIGATGGGGGSGGCAGANGGGGSAGGGSFAVVLVANTSTSNVPTFSGNSISRSNGGAGGAGGIAGSGGDGGVPGEGGTGLIGGAGSFAYCVADGRAGGTGGRGGHGGGGGGGAGGASFDVLVVSSDAAATVSAAGFNANNEFPLDAGSNTGGQGGVGGSSRANSGEDGATGASGRLLQLQP